jgi:Ca2+-binding RTX toxin-like protein
LGNSGDDKLYGQSGHDLVEGQAGRDKLSGGTGRNILVQGGASERVRDRWTDRHGYTGPRGVAVYSDQ